MSKVINIVTRIEEIELPHDAQGGKDLLNHLMEYKALNRSSMSYGEHYLMANIIRMVENNSGVNVCEMIQEMSAK